MRKNIKLVGISTETLRKIKAVNGVKTLSFNFKGSTITLQNSVERPYYFGYLELSQEFNYNVHFKNEIVAFSSNQSNAIDLWLTNATLVKKIKSGSVSSFECEGYIVDLATQKATLKETCFEFVSNERDYNI